MAIDTHILWVVLWTNTAALDTPVGDRRATQRRMNGSAAFSQRKTGKAPLWRKVNELRDAINCTREVEGTTSSRQ